MFGFLQTLLLSFLFCVISFCVSAQSDPMNKPAIWDKLKAAPNDDKLWSAYIGKKLDLLTPKEKEKLANWKQELSIQAIADQEAISSSRTKGTKPAAPLSVEQKKEIMALEQQIMEIPIEFEVLRSNVHENFAILEDLFSHEFKSLGNEYRYYHDVHPDKKYSQIKWVEEQEAKIKMLKKEKVKELWASFGHTN
jgi:hypothetical protein